MKLRVRWLGGAALCAAAVVVLGGMAHSRGAQGAAGPAIAVSPPSQVVHVGDTVKVDVAASGGTNVAAWEVIFRYDPAVLSFGGFQQTDWLTGTGRPQTCPAAIVDSTHGTAQIGCVTTGTGNTPPGLDGGGVLAHATFTTVATGTSNLELLEATLANPNGDDCCGPVAAQEAVVKVVAAGDTAPGDTSLPPTATPNPVKRTPTAIPGFNGGGGSLTLPTGVAAGQTPPAGTIGRGTSGSSGGPPNSGAAGGLFGTGTLSGSSSGAAARATGAPHAGDGTAHSEHSMLVRGLIALFAVAGVGCVGLAAWARRRAGR